MGLSSNISIKANFNERNFMQIIQALVSSGWTFNDYGKFTLLPIGDKDDFDWTSIDKIEQQELFHVFEEKLKVKEIIGIVITWKDTNCGGSLLFDIENENLSINLNINRKLLHNNSRHTDFTWYLEKLVNLIENEVVDIESITCIDA